MGEGWYLTASSILSFSASKPSGLPSRPSRWRNPSRWHPALQEYPKNLKEYRYLDPYGKNKSTWRTKIGKIGEMVFRHRSLLCYIGNHHEQCHTWQYIVFTKTRMLPKNQIRTGLVMEQRDLASASKYLSTSF